LPLESAFPWQFGFKNWQFVLPVDGTVVPKHGGEAPLICVSIGTVSLFCVRNSVHFDIENARKGQL